MPSLRVPSHPPDAQGCVVRVTPESAGWQYVGFEVVRLASGAYLSRETADREVCAVLLSGRADLATRGGRWEDIGERDSVFDAPPYSVYVPSGDALEVTAVTDLEVALCSAPGKGGQVARLITPAMVSLEDRGVGSNLRKIRNVLPDDQPADSLLVVEVITPSGHWSSYPPHKHDRDALPEESYLEETYYHRINPPQGFAFQRVYTDDRSIDETVSLADGDVVMVPQGYHPAGVPPGYELYYLNVMAGPRRSWVFHNDPDHEWLLEALS
jgi:5-deoxy-glucuronate isomerase